MRKFPVDTSTVRTALTSLAFSLLLCSGCVQNVYAPPARVLPLESSATVPEGYTAVSGEFAGSAAALTTPLILSATGRVRHGIHESLEVSGEASVVHLRDPRSVSDANPNLYSLRAGVKRGFSQHFAITGGLGGGYAPAGGGFVSPDLGFVAGYENPYFVPWVNGRGFVSLPFATSPVDVTVENDDERVFSEAEITYGFQLAVGFKIPVGEWLLAPNLRRASLLGGWGMTWLVDDDAADVVNGLSAGFEVTF